MSNVTPMRKQPVRLMERYRQQTFRQTTEQLQAFVAAKRMREMDDHFSQVLADALELELQCARIRESW